MLFPYILLDKSLIPYEDRYHKGEADFEALLTAQRQPKRLISAAMDSNTSKTGVVLGQMISVEEARYGCKILINYCGYNAPLYLNDQQFDNFIKSYFHGHLSVPFKPRQDEYIWLLAAVQFNEKAHLKIKKLGLFRTTRLGIPVDSLYELTLAQELDRQHREYEKPLVFDKNMHYLPDFVLLDTAERVPIEVWGMTTPAYLAHKSVKLENYQAEKTRLWEWYAMRNEAIPDLLPISSRVQHIV